MVDLILTGAEILTPRPSCADSLALAQGKIVKLGTQTEIISLSNTKTRIISLQGQTLVPAFFDTHAHVLQTGLDMQLTPLYEVNSRQELIERMRSCPGGFSTWVGGIGFDETRFADQQLPTKADLDLISLKDPVFIIRRDHHSLVLNTKAMETLNSQALSRSENLGIFRAQRNSEIRKKILSLIPAEDKRTSLHLAAKVAVSKGIGTVNALEGGDLFMNDDLLLIRDYAGSLPLNLIIYPQVKDPDWVAEHLGACRLGGCLLLDGSFGSRTAALSSAYQDEPENCGMLYFSDDELFYLVEKAHLMGFQLSFHAIGDRAIEQIIKAYKRALKLHPRADHRHRIEHCELPSPEQIHQIAELGLHLAVQPTFEHFWGNAGAMYEIRLGKRYLATNPFKTLMAAGIILGGGSDSDVTPMDPLLGIHSAVNHPKPEQALDVCEALELYTSQAARLNFLESQTGTLEEGNVADLAVLSQNPLTSPRESLKNIEVLATIISGDIKYSRLDCML